VDWHHFKEWLEQASGLDMDALHVHAGILIQIAAAFVLRRPLRSPIPWLVVLAAILANELYDFRYEIWPQSERGLQYAESAKDIWNTMLLPTLVLLLARYRPALFAGRKVSAPDPGETGGEGR
jgi:hypothetical protein